MFIKNFVSSIQISGAILLSFGLAFFLLEPAISLGATSESKQFTVSQTISSELSITTAPTNVTMSPSIGGLTGGTANGSTQVVVKTNDLMGYQMTITASSSLGMIGNASSTNYIPVYTPATPGVPDLNFTTTAGQARFGYTVEASTTNEVASVFYDNTIACNAGTSHGSVDSCWMGATSTPFVIINTTGPTRASGSTSTVKFRVVVNGTPNPILPDDTYTATTTLTATVN